MAIAQARRCLRHEAKVSIARALVHDPPVLVFDEPTLGLDVMVARNLLSVVRELKDAGKCIVFSTHIMSEVERLCDRIAIMHRGRILDMGTLEQLQTHHQQSDLEELFFDLLSNYDSRESGSPVWDEPIQRTIGIASNRNPIGAMVERLVDL